MNDLTEPACKGCRGEQWICEDHPAEPAGQCCAAGMPCPVFNEEGLERPVFDVLYASVDMPAATVKRKRAGWALMPARILPFVRERPPRLVRRQRPPDPVATISPELLAESDRLLNATMADWAATDEQ